MCTLPRCMLTADCLQEPRRCHMTGMLFCHDCHHRELARLPALVLHEWDFQKRPVCTLAAQFLASIHEQPLLDIAGISPGVTLPYLLLCSCNHQRCCVYAMAAQSLASNHD